jgi:hypothetical protein
MIRTLDITNVPKEVRSKGAAESTNRFRQLLSNPYLTQAQRIEIQDRLKLVKKLENLPYTPKV